MDTREQFIEDMGVYFEQIGLNRMAGRVVGWLLLCDPPHQSMPDIVEALGASKSSVSTALTLLSQSGLVDRLSLPGERRDYFRVNSDIWTQTFNTRLHLVKELRQLAERGLRLMDDEPPEMRRRLEIMRDLNEFMETEIPKLLERWQTYKKDKGYNES